MGITSQKYKRHAMLHTTHAHAHICTLHAHFYTHSHTRTHTKHKHNHTHRHQHTDEGRTNAHAEACTYGRTHTSSFVLFPFLSRVYAPAHSPITQPWCHSSCFRFRTFALHFCFLNPLFIFFFFVILCRNRFSFRLHFVFALSSTHVHVTQPQLQQQSFFCFEHTNSFFLSQIYVYTISLFIYLSYSNLFVSYV